MEYKDLSQFTQGYIEALFFTENEELSEKDFSDFAPETITKIIEDCTVFKLLNAVLLHKAYTLKHDYDAIRAGSDFWYTRNRHGVGFWDRGLLEVGEKLTENCNQYNEQYAYIGDDGLLYIS